MSWLLLVNWKTFHPGLISSNKECPVWGDFPSLYSRFYEVIILEGTYAIGEGKMQSISLDIELRL
jgi:hypothetical protein